MRLIVFENAAGVPIGFRHGFFAARKLSRFTAPAVQPSQILFPFLLLDA